MNYKKVANDHSGFESKDKAPHPSQEITHLVANGSAVRIATLLAPLAEDMGFVLVRVRFSGSDGQTLQIMAERLDGTMVVEDCEQLSRALSALLDVEDAVSGSYVLEVSSPGLERPLSRMQDFERWVGYEVSLEGVTDSSTEGNRRNWRGILRGIEGDIVLLDTPDTQGIVRMPFETLVRARLTATDEMMRKSLKKQSMMQSQA
ncbi:MAG: ribosome maturation factor RimP [Parvularculales bacterium]